jgi:hypothetical protein
MVGLFVFSLKNSSVKNFQAVYVDTMKRLFCILIFVFFIRLR